jgi:LPS-assembly protein
MLIQPPRVFALSILAAAVLLALDARAQVAPGAAPNPAPEALLKLRGERRLGSADPTGKQEGASYARALSITTEDQERVTLEGDAEVRRGGAVLRGDRIEYRAAADEVIVTGNARLVRDGAIITGPSLKLRMDAQTGSMPNADFYYAKRGGRGRCDLIEFLGEDRVRLLGASYTTCAPGDDSWMIKADKLELDGVAEEAVGRGTSLYFQGVPILASPYFEFPLGDRRRSGLLTPAFGISSRSGAEAALPYYWNIAPNYDATITPRVMQRRGVMLQNELRYLQPNARGTIEYDVMPRDKEMGSQRDFLSLRHNYSNANGLNGGLNYNHVSDDRYFSDFSHNIVVASQAVLPQEAFIGFNRTYWNTALRVVKNQTLLDPDAPVVKPYERAPQFVFNTFNRDWRGLDVSFALDATRFTHPTLEKGDRLSANAAVSYPWMAPGWFVVPKLQWNATSYSLDARLHPDDSRQTIALPIVSLDAGLTYERAMRWLGAASTQTLEPRFFYAYIPYRDQSRLPNFDSALADFNFSQLFNENIFVGGDRVGEANQITAALVSRVIDDEGGAEKLRASIGQRFYFASQRVTLPGGAARAGNASDILLALSGALSRHWWADFAVQHATQEGRMVRTTAAVRWQPRPDSMVNLAYRYKIGELEQLDMAGQWPLSARWHGVARANYSLRDGRWVELLGGVEYRADCWVGRVVAHRFVTTSTSASTSIFFQLELNGLASIGSSPLEQLQRNIPGYRLANPPPGEPGRFNWYE